MEALLFASSDPLPLAKMVESPIPFFFLASSAIALILDELRGEYLTPKALALTGRDCARLCFRTYPQEYSPYLDLLFFTGKGGVEKLSYASTKL